MSDGSIGVVFGLLALFIVGAIIFFGTRNAPRAPATAVVRRGPEQAWLDFYEAIKRTRTIPTVPLGDLVPEPHEFGVLRAPCMMLEWRASRVSSGVGTRVKVGSLPVYLGTSKSRAVDELREAARGDLVLTNRRIVFVGDRKTFDSALAALTVIHADAHGLHIVSSRRAKPVVFAVGNPLFWRETIRLLSATNLDAPALPDNLTLS